MTLQEIGAQDQITQDLITQLQKDTILNQYPFYESEKLIKIRPDLQPDETQDIDPPTELPCHSIQLYNNRRAKNPCSGGNSRTFDVDCRCGNWISAVTRDPTIPSLYVQSERIDSNLYLASLNDELPSYIKEYDYLKSYPRAFDLPVHNILKTVAYVMFTEFTLQYVTTP